MVKNRDKSLLSTILDLRKIKAVVKPIEEAHGLPNECYTSNEYLKFELNYQIFQLDLYYHQLLKLV